MTGVQAIALPLFDPTFGRVERTFDPGASIDEIVRTMLPGATEADLASVRVLIVGDESAADLPRENWRRTYPIPTKARVVIRQVPGSDDLGSWLQIAVTVAAMAAATYFTGGLAAIGTIGGGTGYSAFTLGAVKLGIFAGVQVLGSLAINALIPPRDQGKPQDRPGALNFQNEVRPDGYIPLILAKDYRYAPPMAALPYLERIGDDTFIVSMFNWGYYGLGLNLDKFKLGDTPLYKAQDEWNDPAVPEFRYHGVQHEILHHPVQKSEIYRSQVIEQDVATQLLNENGDGDEVIRVTAQDVTEFEIDLAFPSGLISYDDKGNAEDVSNGFRVRYRPVTGGAWITEDEEWKISARKAYEFTRSRRVKPAVRGTWEVGMRRNDQESTDPKKQDRTIWQTLRSFRPEYPINSTKDLLLSVLRIKATKQLQGVRNYNAEVSRVAWDWDVPTQTWILRATNSPPALDRFMLQSQAIAYPQADADLNLPMYQHWAEICAAKGWRYNRAHDYRASVWDVRSDICARGHASPVDNGEKSTIVIDQPKTLVIDHISPRNSWGLQGEPTFFKPPQGVRVPFQDQSNDFIRRERIVPWDGWDVATQGEPALTELWDQFPGVTDPEQIYREAKWRIKEARYRSETVSVFMHARSIQFGRFDMVRVSHDILSSGMRGARIVQVDPSYVVIDEEVEMVEGVSYALRIATLPAAEEPPTAEWAYAPVTSTVRSLLTVPGRTRALYFAPSAGPVPTPNVGDEVQFGVATRETEEMIVKDIEPGDRGLVRRIVMVPHAPHIQAEVDALVVPLWDGRVGTILPPSTAAPLAPIIVRVTTGEPGTATSVAVTVEPDGKVPVSSIRVEHRLSGVVTWQPVTIPASAGVAFLPGYGAGQRIFMRAQSFSTAGVPSPYTGIVEYIVGTPERDELAATATEGLGATATDGLGAT